MLLLLPLCVSEVFAQAPPYLNYQGVARDRDGQVLQEKALSLRISILRDGPSGREVYSERHAVQTNDLGMFTLLIGKGDLRQGALDALDWGRSSYWLQVEMDEHGGHNYSLLGASQLLSVPYAFHAIHAEKADRLTASDANNATGPGQGSQGSPWSTSGNLATDAAVDFIGTVDDEDVVFRTDNIERMRLTAYGKLGIGTPAPVSAVDIMGNTTIGLNYAGMYAAPESGLLVEGNVGIGQPYPGAKLEVAGEFVVGKNFTGTYMPPLDGALFQGRVGIGTQSPGSWLSVKGGVSIGNNFSENAAPANGAAIEGQLGVGTTIPKSTVGIAGNTSIGARYAREFMAPMNGLIVQGDVGFGTEAPLSRLGVAGNVSIGSIYASTYPAPEDGLMVQGPLWSGVTESEYEFHVLGNSFLDGTAEITGNTKVGGTLDVDGVTTLHDLTDVPVIMDMQSVHEGNFLGSLHVKGGAGVEMNHNVGVDLGVGRDTYVGRNLKVGGTANFKNLIVENYADIGRNPDPIYDEHLNPDPIAPVTLINKGETILEGKVSVTDATPSTNSTNGALVVDGGVGVGGNVNIAGQMHVDYSSHSAVSSGSKEQYPLYISGATQGLAVHLNVGTNSKNHYIGFWDKDKKWGSIQGESLAERYLNHTYILMTINHVYESVMAIADLVSEIADFRVGVGLGAVTVTPGPSKIIFATAKLIAQVAKVIHEQVEWALNRGVAYTSGNADYAEWLERADPDEIFVFGDIVGARGGKISKDIQPGDMVFVISKSPIVLGNVPNEGREHLYEMCAFLGQVPVKVLGPVNIGDYIIPSGKGNGIGVAVNPTDLTADQAGLVVGVAWSDLAPGLAGYVNAAVGMPVKAGVEVLQKHQTAIASLQTKVDAMEAVLRELIPDFDERLAVYGVDMADATPADGMEPSTSTDPHVDPLPSPDPVKADPNLLTEELFARAVEVARYNFRAMGHDPDENPMLKRLEENASFRHDYLVAVRSLIATGGDRNELERLLKEMQ